MKVQIVSSLLSTKVLESIRAISGQYPAYAAQKFYRVLAEGFIKNSIEVEVLSNPPHFSSNKRYVSISGDSENGVIFKYMPFVRIPIIRHIFLCLNAFFNCLEIGHGKEKSKFIICDVLCYSTAMGALIASKILRKKIVGIVTDIPWLIDTDGKTPLSMKMLRGFQKWYIRRFTHYVFLTEQMNYVINRKNRPHIIVEGFANINMSNIDNNLLEKNYPKQLLYAGFLQAKYGLKMLVEAFMSLKDLNASLIIYGTGPFVEELKQYQLNDRRIEYRGLASNDKVVDAEMKASILVNPRPTHEEYTKYSFPSKNMEYMASGTPVLTTRLPGMPDEYFSHIYSFDEESVDGYARVLQHVITLSAEELHNKGIEAKEWVLQNKNNCLQCKRIIDMINQY